MLRVSGTEVRSVAAGDCDDDDDDDDDAGSEGGHDVTEERFPRCWSFVKAEVFESFIICISCVTYTLVVDVTVVFFYIQGSYYFAEFIFPDFSRQSE